MRANSYHTTWQDETQTAAFASKLASALARTLPREGGLSIALEGDLGAGKTTLVRYLLRALGVGGRIKSPSYAIVESYDTSAFPAWHFDFYRMSSAAEWEDAGFREIFTGHGLRLVEWPGQLPAGLVPYDLRMTWTLEADTLRHIQLQATSPAGQQLLQDLEHE